MNFTWAVEQLNNKKLVRRTSWDEGYLLLNDRDLIVNNKHQKVKFNHINSLLADDWELFKEKNSLINIHCLDRGNKICFEGSAFIYDSPFHTSNIVIFTELEEFEYILKKAKEVRDKK